MAHHSSNSKFYYNKLFIFNDKIWSFDKKIALKKLITSVHRYFSYVRILMLLTIKILNSFMLSNI